MGRAPKVKRVQWLQASTGSKPYILITLCRNLRTQQSCIFMELKYLFVAARNLKAPGVRWHLVKATLLMELDLCLANQFTLILKEVRSLRGDPALQPLRIKIGDRRSLRVTSPPSLKDAQATLRELEQHYGNRF
jgi:hypothetical protein